MTKTSIRYALSALAVLVLSQLNLAFAHDATHVPSQPESVSLADSSLQVQGPLAPLPADTTDMKFKDMFKMPVGPYGMEPSAKLMALQNKRIRIVGYMANQESFTPGMFILSPLPVHMGDEDDKFADDMPANSIFVHLDDASKVVHFIPGLIVLTGVLNVGNKHEADDRISFVRLTLDSAQSSLLLPQVPVAVESASQQSWPQKQASQ